MDLQKGIQQIKILHFAMASGVVLFGAVSFAVHEYVFERNPFEGILPFQGLYVLGIAALLLLFGAGYYFRSTMQAMEERGELKERLAHYRKSHMLRLALVEASALAIVMGYLLTGNLLFLLLGAIPMTEFLRSFPRDSQMADLLKLSYSEQQQLEVRSS